MYHFKTKGGPRINDAEEEEHCEGVIAVELT